MARRALYFYVALVRSGTAGETTACHGGDRHARRRQRGEAGGERARANGAGAVGGGVRRCAARDARHAARQPAPIRLTLYRPAWAAIAPLPAARRRAGRAAAAAERPVASRQASLAPAVRAYDAPSECGAVARGRAGAAAGAAACERGGPTDTEAFERAGPADGEAAFEWACTAAGFRTQSPVECRVAAARRLAALCHQVLGFVLHKRHTSRRLDAAHEG